MDQPPLAIGLAAGSAVAAILALSGSVDASILAVALLVVAVRAFALGAIGGVASLQRWASSVPALALLAVTAAVRAGSADLDAIRGANAVAGLGIAYGPLLTAVGVIVAAVGGVVALGTIDPVGARVRGVADLFDALGVLLGAWMIVTVTVGPQVEDLGDLLTWTVGIVAVVAMSVAVPRVRQLPAIAAILGVAGLGLVIAGGPL